MDLNHTTVSAALAAHGGVATSHEVCESLGASSSYERERVQMFLHRAGYEQVPIAQIGRFYKTGNRATTRWAYRKKDVPVQS